MRYFLWLCLFALPGIGLSQDGPLAVVDDMPRFPGCDQEGATKEQMQQCSNQELLRFIYQHIVYPDSAIVNQAEGTVVVRFVVKTDGQIADASILKDIGHGCGEEAKRVVELMNEKGIVWTPGKLKEEVKDVYFNLPVRFKLEEPAPDYVVIDGDTIYTVYNSAPGYTEGPDALATYLQQEVKYPAQWADSCLVGAISCDVLIRANKQAIVMDSYNYAGLPDDFLFEVVRLIARTSGQWTPAIHTGREVGAIYPIRVTFEPPGGSCVEQVRRMQQSIQLGEEAAGLYEAEKAEEAIAKWTAAIEAFPESVEFRIWRGAAYVESNEFEMACPDLQAVKSALGKTGYDNLLPLICQ